MSFGDHLRRLRLHAGLTQEQLAERSGMSTRAVSDLERDPTRVPRLSTVRLLADALDLDGAGRQSLLVAARPRTPTDGPAQRASRIRSPRAVIIGRDAEHELLVRLLSDSGHRLIAVTGPGGVGKTTLALAVASSVAPSAVFVDLAPVLHPEDVVPAIARSLGIEADGPLPLLERVQAALQRDTRLLVIDNLEHVLDARTDLGELLDTVPGLRALVTSRVPLRIPGERELRLAPLRTPQPDEADPTGTAAFRLLTARAEALGADITPGDEPALAAICRRLDGLPLALELAASRLRLRSPDELLADLDAGVPGLGAAGPELPDRQRTMQATIAWSQHLLSPPAREVLRELAVFSGGTTTETVTALTGVDLDLLQEIVESGLALTERHGPRMRVRLLEPVREVCLRELQASPGYVDTLRRHGEHLLSSMVSDSLEREDLPTLLTVLHDGGQSDNTELAYRLAGAAARPLIRHGWLSEGQQAVEAVLSADRSDTQAATVLLATTSALELANARWDQAAARARVEELPALLAAVHEPGPIARAHLARGWFHRQRNDYASAEADFVDAERCSADGADDLTRLRALLGRTYAAFFLGRIDDARNLAAEAITGAEAGGHTREEAEGLQLLAWAHTHRGEHERAMELATASTAAFRELGDTGKVGEALRVEAHTYDDLGRLPEATARLREGQRDLLAPRGAQHRRSDQLPAQPPPAPPGPAR